METLKNPKLILGDILKRFDGLMSVRNKHLNENQHKMNCIAVDRAASSCQTRKTTKMVIHAKKMTKQSLVYKECPETNAVNLFFAFLSIVCENEMETL